MSSNLPQTYVTYREITGSRADKQEFIQKLKRFSSKTMLGVCSVVNLTLAQWEDGYDEQAHARLVRTFFGPDLANALLAMRRPVFHRHQLLFLAQEALRHCEVGRQDQVRPSQNRELGILMLMASELLADPASRAPTRSQELARRIASVLPDMETNGPLSYHRKMARSVAMCTRFADQLRGATNFFDVDTLFRDATGISLEMFYALTFGSVSRFLKLEQIKASKNISDYALHPNFFRKCRSVTPTELERFFSYVSADATSYADQIRKKNPKRSDFTVLRNKPLFADGGQYWPLDISLLADKLESGVFWSAHDQIDEKKKRDKFHQFWGDVFERYAAWVIGASVDGKINRFVPNPRYRGREQDQVCDGIVVSGATAIFIESKGSTLSAKGKYGGDANVLDAELSQKFLGTQSSRKGVHQLVDALQSLFAKNPPDEISGLDLRSIDTVIPLVLTRDDIGSAFNFSAYLNFHFQELVQGICFTRAVSPLSAASIDEFERLSPYLVDVSLSEVLLARIDLDPDLLFPLWFGGNAVLATLEGRASPLLEAEIEKLGEICINRLGIKDEDVQPAS